MVPEVHLFTLLTQTLLIFNLIHDNKILYNKQKEDKACYLNRMSYGFYRF